jgi:hypothetical protein
LATTNDRPVTVATQKEGAQDRIEAAPECVQQ